MKKIIAMLLSLCMLIGCAALAEGETVLTGSAAGFASDVSVEFTVDADGKITALTVDDSGESYPTAGIERENSVEKLIAEILEAGSADGVDTATGATFTSTAVVEAINKALAANEGGEADGEAAELAFTAGTYEATADGYNGPVTVSVTYSEDAIQSIEIVSSAETDHVGTVAYDIMIPEMLEVNGAGVDGVSGATFTTRALRSAVLDTAEQAGCTNLDGFKAAKITHEAGAPITLDYDVVVVGAGGAGMAAAAQAAQDGNTVLVIEKNAEVGGNTLVSGGQYQSVMPYLVWDPADPDATTGVYEFDGQTYDKVKSVQGCIDELKMILDWSEEPFDADYYVDHEFVAGRGRSREPADPVLHPEPAHLPDLLRRPAPERGQERVDLRRRGPGEPVHQRRPGPEGVAGGAGRHLQGGQPAHPDRRAVVS